MNKKKNIINLIITAFLFIASVVFTFIVMKVDVQEIGPQGSSVGLAGVNKKVAEAFGYNDVFYVLTQCFGYVIILIAAIFFIAFIVQIIVNRGLKGISADTYLLILLYVAVAALYILFDKAAINYRPVLLNEELEPSYPSSHTLFAATIIPTAIVWVKGRVKNRKIFIVYCVLGALLAAATVIFRLISGVHWFTDIVGGLLIGAALTMANYSLAYIFRKQA